MKDKNFEAPVSTVWMSATDAAAALGISRQQLNKQIGWGEFPSTERVGTSYNLKIAEVEAVKLKRETVAHNKEA